MNVQFTTMELEGKHYAIVPLKDLKLLEAAAEMLADIQAYDEAKREWRESGEEALPHALVKRIVLGEHPVKVYREHRGLTQAELGRRAGVTGTYIFMLESGRRKGQVATLKKLAAALGVTLEQLA